MDSQSEVSASLALHGAWGTGRNTQDAGCNDAEPSASSHSGACSGEVLQEGLEVPWDAFSSEAVHRQAAPSSEGYASPVEGLEPFVALPPWAASS